MRCRFFVFVGDDFSRTYIISRKQNDFVPTKSSSTSAPPYLIYNNDGRGFRDVSRNDIRSGKFAIELYPGWWCSEIESPLKNLWSGMCLVSIFIVGKHFFDRLVGV